MGVATTDVLTRVMASLGKLEQAPTDFPRACEAVRFGGVLCAIPALLASGLLKNAARFFSLPAGYYGLEHIFIILGIMTLCRIKSIEQLRSTAPGEWGKLLGLDRCPEAKTLREKIAILTTDGDPAAWSAQLCADWMQAAPEAVGTLYIDGHCRVYHGSQTKLPRHYIARQKLCLRATTDYWVHGLDGLPLFKINQAVDPGMIHVLETEIVPELEKIIPNQPTAEALAADPQLHRFRLIFDREGSSPGFFKRMADKRIACQTYRKNPGPDWPESEFTPVSITLMAGTQSSMMLAERSVAIGTAATDKIQVREIRKRTESGHQIAIISTDWKASQTQIVAPQFGRWSQENFFKYGREHFNLDALIDYQLEAVTDTTRLTNPAWRKLDGAIRKRLGLHQKLKAKLHDHTHKGELESARTEAYIARAITLKTDLQQSETELVELKTQRRAIPQHITVGELPAEDQFLKLANRSKHFIDTIKIIAYRAETAMAGIVREKLNQHHQDESRALIRAICTTEADLRPDPIAKTLTIELHALATPKSNAALTHLCKELSETETQYPGTELRMIFKLVSN